VIDGQMPVGSMATFTTLLISLVSILTSLAWVLAAISRGVVAVSRVDGVLQAPDELPKVERELSIDAPPRIELRGLSFVYPDGDAPALEGVTATVDPGGTLGIFGKTGSGKSTLVNVLARVQTPPPGTVLVDGVDATTVSLSQYRDALAVVPQSAFLFSTSLRENIRLADANPWRARKGDAPPDPRLDEVLEAASLTEDIGQLPDGLDTVVGERGVMLSGGQRQRASLARALYRTRPVLLLDDVLSAVDQGTEAKMVEAIRSLRAGSLAATAPTTIIVSHRTSVLEHADEILVLDRGRVIERGTHAQLVAAGGEYALTHLHQARGDTA
jgi:ATP-binding cassette subfamily B protein